VGDAWFHGAVATLGGSYVLLVVLLIVADLTFTSPGSLLRTLDAPEIRYALALSLLTATITAILCVWVAVPCGYAISRWPTEFEARSDALGADRKRLKRRVLRGAATLLEALLDIPIVLPPLVVGISLLVLFQFQPFSWTASWVVYEIPAIILAQFVVSCAFAIRTMRATFDEIPRRQEHVAMTLGATRSQAFWTVLMPQARRGVLAAGTLAWARALGEFGPILVFASATRMRTEVLPTTIYLEMQAGNLEAALAVSVGMVLCAVAVLMLTRWIGWRHP
jgi:molybdate transport system permease protein